MIDRERRPRLLEGREVLEGLSLRDATILLANVGVGDGLSPKGATKSAPLKLFAVPPHRTPFHSSEVEREVHLYLAGPNVEFHIVDEVIYCKTIQECLCTTRDVLAWIDENTFPPPPPKDT